MTSLSHRVVEYLDHQGRSPFARWLAQLDAQAAARVVAVVYRLGSGNDANVKSVGSGVLERTIHSGPGYRIYFARDGEAWVILLGGSTKRRQQNAIDAARERWNDYRARKREKQG